MKASFQERGFQIWCSLDTLGPVPESALIFSNKDLPSTPGKQPGAALIAYNALEVSWIVPYW